MPFPADDSGQHGKPSGTPDISLYFNDIEETVAELSARGVEFDGGIQDVGFGLASWILAPGDLRIQLYEPRDSKRNA